MADLQGLLGGSLLPEQTRQGSYRDNMLGAIASTGAGMRQGLGKAVGMDTRTDGERAKEELGKLDPTNPADQKKIIALVAPIDSQKAMEMQAKFKAENLAKTKASEQQAYDRGRNTKADALAERKQDWTESGKGNSFKPEEAKTIERWDPDRNANVTDFYYPSNPNEVVRTTLSGIDVGGATATSLKIYDRVSLARQEAVKLVHKAERTANKLIEAIDLNSGYVGDFDEWLANALGEQGDPEQARTMITNLINGNAIANLPKGPASDKDIALVMMGEPPRNAKPSVLADYARGIAKLAKAEAKFFTDQQRWMDRNDGELSGFGTYMNMKSAEETLSGMNPEVLKAMEAAYGREDEEAMIGYFYEDYGFNLADMKEELKSDKKTLENYKGI